jgi:hypothetical protein
MPSTESLHGLGLTEDFTKPKKETEKRGVVREISPLCHDKVLGSRFFRLGRISLFPLSEQFAAIIVLACDVFESCFYEFNCLPLVS